MYQAPAPGAYYYPPAYGAPAPHAPYAPAPYPAPGQPVMMVPQPAPVHYVSTQPVGYPAYAPAPVAAPIYHHPPPGAYYAPAAPQSSAVSLSIGPVTVTASAGSRSPAHGAPQYAQPMYGYPGGALPPPARMVGYACPRCNGRGKTHEGPGKCNGGGCIFDKPCGCAGGMAPLDGAVCVKCEGRGLTHEGPGRCTKSNCIFDQPCGSCGKSGVVSVRSDRRYRHCTHSIDQNRRVVCPRCDGKGKVHDSNMHHQSSNCIFCTACNSCRGQGML